jgi:hypothetical protein
MFKFYSFKDHEENSESSVVIAKSYHHSPVLCISRFNYATAKHHVQIISRYGSCEFLVQSRNFGLRDERMLEAFFPGWQTEKMCPISSKFKLNLINAFGEWPSAENFNFLLRMLQQSNEHGLQRGQQVVLWDEADYSEFKNFI